MGADVSMFGWFALIMQNVSDERKERNDHRLEAAEFKPTPTLQEHGKNDESMTRGMKGALHVRPLLWRCMPLCSSDRADVRLPGFFFFFFFFFHHRATPSL
jgi:hypothetical protein